jgi:release factor H-coupled RctB family protein
VLASHTYVENNAREQLFRAFQLPFMRTAVGMPDLHLGKGCPVGASFLSEHVIYPGLVGADIGCGCSMYATTLRCKREKRLDQFATRLRGLDDPCAPDVVRTFLRRRGGR